MSRALARAAGLRRLLAEPGFGRRLLVGELAAGALMLGRGIELAKDSRGYLDGAVYRGPLYPLLLDALELVFGGLGLAALLVLQVALGLLAVGSLVLYLRRSLGLPEWLAWLALALLLGLPYLGPLAVASRVLSEAVAYPLFLLAMRYLLEAVLARRLDRFGAAAAWSALLLLARQQFLFLLPVLALCALLWLVERTSRRRALAALALVTAVATGTWLADRTYRLARHERFAAAPYAGLQILAGALYVAPAEAAAALPAEQRQLFGALHSEGEARGLLASANPSPGGISSYAWHFRQSYNDIVWHLIVPEMRRRTGAEPGGEDWFAIEERLLPLARSLIRARPLAWARLVLSNLLSGLSVPYAILLAVIVPLALARGLWRGGATDLVAGVSTLTHLANCTLVAIVEPLKMRYSFYTDGLVLVALLALLAAGGVRQPGSDVRHRG